MKVSGGMLMQGSKKILVVDDEEILRMLIADTLSFEGYEVEEAADGQEGFDKASVGEYDVILLDYMMPKLTGPEVLERLQPLDLNSPIIMLTAKAQQPDRDLAAQLGAQYFMPKPFSPADLVALVQQVIEKSV